MSAPAARALAVGVALAALLGVACEASPGGAGASGAAGAAATEDKSGNCASCHLAEYAAASDPVHVDVKPTKCGVCHVEEGWRPSSLHHAWWALTGAHEKAECSFCHKGAPVVYRGTAKECVGCHRADYDASTYPGHQSFQTKCTDCHGTTGWKPSKYVPPPVVATAPKPLASATPPLLKNGKLPLGAKPTANPPVTPPPRVPTSRPPPDVTSHPSPRR